MSSWAPWSAMMDNNNRTNTVTEHFTQKVLSQDAVNKLIYDVLSSDQGLASLASGENISGGFKSSTKSLLAQDLVVKLVGELANITATTKDVKDERQDKGSKIGTKITVICTELNRQGLLENELYEHPAAISHFCSLHPAVIRGYHSWAVGVAAYLASSPRLSRWITPIARSRYKMITTGKFHFLGAITIYLAQPVCFLIGKLLGEKNGRFQSA